MPAPPSLRSDLLSSVPRVRHAFFTRAGGVSAGTYASLNGGLGSADDPALVLENRRRMAETLAAATLVTAYQVHSASAVVVERPWEWKDAPRVDGIATRVPGLAIGVGIADCCPVLFADRAAGVVGAAHAGWKGALGGVLEATLDAMESIGADRRSIVAALGACIRQPSYEVGEDFMRQFCAAEPRNERFFALSPGERPHFDLPGYVRSRLETAGLGAIDDLGLDTYADETRFFSYRRMTHRGEPDYGRLIAAIALAG